MGYKYKNYEDLMSQLKKARQVALSEAKATGYKHVPSRGTFLCTSNKKEGQVDPALEGDMLSWDWTLRQIKELVAKVEANYPEVDEVYLAGGYDGAESVRDYIDGCYEPCLGMWDLVVWSKEEQKVKNDKV